MFISTKGRYAVKILGDIVENGKGEYIALKDIAERQGISLKYIERIVAALKDANLIESARGVGGGYKLSKKPSEYNLWEILVAVEGETAPVACMQSDAVKCEKRGDCKTFPIWSGYYDATKKYFEKIKLSDVF